MLKIKTDWQGKNLPDSYFWSSMTDVGCNSPELTDSFKVLDDHSLAEFWQLNFGNDGRRRRIPNDWWGFCHPSAKLDIEWDNYLDAAQVAYVSCALRDSCNLLPDEQIYFFGGIEVVATSWRDFREYWNAFYDLNDEGICCSVKTAEGLMFSPRNAFILFSNQQSSEA